MTNKTEISSGNVGEPLTVTVAKACELSGFGPTSIWAFLKDGRLEARRVPGIRRTLISYPSLLKLLAPPSDKASPGQQFSIPQGPEKEP